MNLSQIHVDISVIISTHNPDAGRLRQTLAGLRAQTLPVLQWETLLVDNASTPALYPQAFSAPAPDNLRLTREPQLGLTSARRRGFSETRGKFIVLVDDDNVLAPDYLAKVRALFADHPSVGALGGKNLPEFEQPPPAWMREFDGLIACRDYGDVPEISQGLWKTQNQRNEYPRWAPIGAGMALRREAAQSWLRDASATQLSDRRGSELTSGGDNDIILSLMQSGWDVGYFPSLALTHLIPSNRITRDYLARLNRGIASSWVQVLTKHHACPWGPIAAWTVPLRQAKAWFTYRAWSSPAAYIRWQGACGHFASRAALPSRP